jgi:hypothetical protein
MTYDPHIMQIMTALRLREGDWTHDTHEGLGRELWVSDLFLSEPFRPSIISK